MAQFDTQGDVDLEAYLDSARSQEAQDRQIPYLAFWFGSEAVKLRCYEVARFTYTLI
jgi:hypothetical protein